MASADEPLYTMAVAVRLTGMHPQTLRKYERSGLVAPARPSGNQRLYSASDIERLKRIQFLVEEKGINVAGLELALAMTDRLDELSNISSREDMQSAIEDAGAMSRQPMEAEGAA
ncbi:MAG TPA: MerR family transcriptional regulator [Candidatus Limnocylindrales bacterium]